jgi:hypothetical protein
MAVTRKSERKEKRVENEVKEMKKFRIIFVLFTALVLCGGCNFLMGPDAPAKNDEGNLVIRFGGESPGGKAITTGAGLPGDVKAAMRYEFTLTGPDGEITTHAVLNGENLVMTAALGDWRIDVRAYQRDSTTLAGTGSLSFTVAPGTNTVTVPIYIAGTCYEIIPDSSISDGVVGSNFSAAFPGTTITLTATPNTGCVFIPGSFEYSTDGGYTYTTMNNATFTMPASDVTIRGYFLPTVRYVVAGGTGSGLSWSDPSGDLQMMMDELASIASDGLGPCIVKMGAGIYKPKYEMDIHGDTNTATPVNDRDSTFMLRPGVQVWGGYPAAGGPDTGRGMDPTWITTLNGDINGDNTPNDNAYHVVLGINIDDGTILDGLRISGGNASGTSPVTIMGKNVYQRYGAGMYLDSSSPVLINVTISGNEANQTGGGMYNLGSSPVLINSTLSGNQAYYGGGIYNDGSSPVLINVLISGNLASQTGGGMENAGTDSSPVLTNVTIAGNKALTNGGGMYNNSAGQARIRNSVIWGNRAFTWTNGIGATGSAPTVSSSIVEDSAGSGTGWIHPSANNGGGNAADPGSLAPHSPFTDWEDPGSVSTPNNLGTYTLNSNPGNPAAGAGNDSLYPANANDPVFPASLSTGARAAINAVLGKDRAGSVRKNGVIDMGAFER